MPRKRNPLAVTVGKLILAIEKERGEVADRSVNATYEVLNRAHTLQHAAHNGCVRELLSGRSLTEYLDAAWITMHPEIKPCIDAIASELSAHEHS